MIEFEKVILISIKDQKLLLIQDNIKIAEYPISTSKFGIGNKAGSNMTPLGFHMIKEKIGDHVQKNSIFKDSKFTKEIVKINSKRAYDEDLITTRILKLEGMEKGINKGGDIDSYKRGIWIHGTPAESNIGTPASHGCIRMKSDDIVLLFNSVDIGTPVNIEMKIMAKVQEKKDLFADRRHTFRLIDRRKKGVLDSSLWKINSKERRKEDERRSRK